MDIKNFKDLLFNKALNSGFSDSEIYYYSGKSLKISVLDGQIEKFDNTTSGGLSFRGFYNGKMGYSYTERIDETVIDILIQNAKENAEIINEEEKEEIYSGDENYTPVKTFYEKLEDVDVDILIKKALEIEKYVLNYDEKIVRCNNCVVGKSSGKIYISNSKGLELKKEFNYILGYAVASAKYGDEVKTGMELVGSFDIDKIDCKFIGENASKKAISSLGAKSLPSKKYKVIFENECFTDLFSCFLGSFFAENVQKGFSLFKDKLNTKVFNEKITILDEPLMKDGYVSNSFDSEGVACFNKTVVENGVLKTYLYNTKTAKKDGVKSTGNGFKSGYKGTIGISPTNFYIKNGTKSLENILKEVENGIYITELAGLHSGVNSISGDFSVLASGYIIENGKISKSIEQITIADNFYTMILNIKDIADDLKFSLSGIGTPSVYVGEMSISGE